MFDHFATSRGCAPVEKLEDTVTIAEGTALHLHVP